MRRHTGGTVAVLAGALIASTPATSEAAPGPTLPTPSVGISLPLDVPPADPTAEPGTTMARPPSSKPTTTRPQRRATTQAAPASPGRVSATTDRRGGGRLAPPPVPAGAVDDLNAPAESVTASSDSSPAGPGATADAGTVWLAVLAALALLAGLAVAALIRRPGISVSRTKGDVTIGGEAVRRSPVRPATPGDVPLQRQSPEDGDAATGLDPESIEAARRIARRLQKPD